jgi:hypothetical protein
MTIMPIYLFSSTHFHVLLSMRDPNVPAQDLGLAAPGFPSVPYSKHLVLTIRLCLFHKLRQKDVPSLRCAVPYCIMSFLPRPIYRTLISSLNFEGICPGTGPLFLRPKSVELSRLSSKGCLFLLPTSRLAAAATAAEC